MICKVYFRPNWSSLSEDGGEGHQAAPGNRVAEDELKESGRAWLDHALGYRQGVWILFQVLQEITGRENVVKRESISEEGCLSRNLVGLQEPR